MFRMVQCDLEIYGQGVSYVYIEGYILVGNASIACIYNPPLPPKQLQKTSVYSISFQQK